MLLEIAALIVALGVPPVMTTAAPLEPLMVPPSTVIGPPLTLTRLMPWRAPVVVTLWKFIPLLSIVMPLRFRPTPPVVAIVLLDPVTLSVPPPEARKPSPVVVVMVSCLTVDSLKATDVALLPVTATALPEVVVMCCRIVEVDGRGGVARHGDGVVGRGVERRGGEADEAAVVVLDQYAGSAVGDGARRGWGSRLRRSCFPRLRSCPWCW